MLHERSNITVSFAEHLKFQEKVTFTQIRIKKLKSKHYYTYENAIYRLFRELCNIAASFKEYLQISRKNGLYTCIFGE